jgi:predicted nucleic acid binding AN1-type Zn finger protein
MISPSRVWPRATLPASCNICRHDFCIDHREDPDMSIKGTP